MSTQTIGTFVPGTYTPVQQNTDSIPTPTEQDRQALRQEVLQEWIRTTNESLEALLTWRAYLQAWLNHPCVPISDEFFMSLIRNMDEAYLLDWLDTNPAGLDTLREVITGTEVKADMSLLDYLERMAA